MTKISWTEAQFHRANRRVVAEGNSLLEAARKACAFTSCEEGEALLVARHGRYLVVFDDTLVDFLDGEQPSIKGLVATCRNGSLARAA